MRKVRHMYKFGRTCRNVGVHRQRVENWEIAFDVQVSKTISDVHYAWVDLQSYGGPSYTGDDRTRWCGFIDATFHRTGQWKERKTVSKFYKGFVLGRMFTTDDECWCSNGRAKEVHCLSLLTSHLILSVPSRTIHPAEGKTSFVRRISPSKTFQVSKVSKDAQFIRHGWCDRGSG